MDNYVSKKYTRYLNSLKKLKVNDSLWIVDTGAGHGLTPKKGWFRVLQKDSSNTFLYPNGSKSNSSFMGQINFKVFMVLVLGFINCFLCRNFGIVILK